jgi:hypothetical protein
MYVLQGLGVIIDGGIESNLVAAYTNNRQLHCLLGPREFHQAQAGFLLLAGCTATNFNVVQPSCTYTRHSNMILSVDDPTKSMDRIETGPNDTSRLHTAADPTHSPRVPDSQVLPLWQGFLTGWNRLTPIETLIGILSAPR